MKILCTGCNCQKVEARLTSGAEIYPHRFDLSQLPFWKCDTCGNFVGCHHKTENKFRPLGCIPTPAIKAKRQEIHRVLDPLWRNGLIKRNELYRRLSNALGYKYHTAQIRSVEEAENVLSLLSNIKQELSNA